MEGKFTSVHDALYQKPNTHPLLSTGLNPHIQKFMERKAPKPIAIRTANHVREDVSIVHYPKPELKDTVILCAAPCFGIGPRPSTRRVPIIDTSALRLATAGKT